MKRMKQSNTASSKLLRKIISDLRDNIWNYSNVYEFNYDNSLEIIYQGEILHLKNMAENAILNKDYDKALTYYKHANKMIRDEKCKFISQIRLLEQIVKIINDEKELIIMMLNYKKSIALENNDEELYLESEKYLIKLKAYSSKEILLEMNRLIDDGKFHFLINKILNEISSTDKLNKNGCVIDYLKAKNIEGSLNRVLLCSDSELINDRLDKIRRLLNGKKYEEAKRVAYNSLYSTNYPIFYYYLGKCCFKLGDYDSTEEYFAQYRQFGAEKYFKTNVYLYSIYRYRRKNMKEQANSFIHDIEEICSCLDINDFMVDFNYIPYNLSNNRVEDYYDLKPTHMLAKVKMKEEDFLKRD